VYGARNRSVMMDTAAAMSMNRSARSSPVTGPSAER
jgi:hypothetical protein